MVPPRSEEFPHGHATACSGRAGGWARGAQSSARARVHGLSSAPAFCAFLGPFLPDVSGALCLGMRRRTYSAWRLAKIPVLGRPSARQARCGAPALGAAPRHSPSPCARARARAKSRPRRARRHPRPHRAGPRRHRVRRAPRRPPFGTARTARSPVAILTDAIASVPPGSCPFRRDHTPHPPAGRPTAPSPTPPWSAAAGGRGGLTPCPFYVSVYSVHGLGRGRPCRTGSDPPSWESGCRDVARPAAMPHGADIEQCTGGGRLPDG